MSGLRTQDFFGFSPNVPKLFAAVSAFILPFKAGRRRGEDGLL